MPTTPEVVAHLYRRAGFGASPEQVASSSQLDLVDLVDSLLDRTAEPPVVPPPPLTTAGASGWDQWASSVQWWLDRMATTPVPLVEKMALFWHGHFVSSLDKVGDMTMMWRQVDLYRRLGTGGLRQLAQAMAVEPAMLRYLDGASSVAGSPNQNFARELFELFLLGIGSYTEEDVDASARAWTGHGIDGGVHRFSPERHDSGTKALFGVDAAYGGPDVIDAVFERPATRQVCARFVAAKLWTHFAHPDPPEAVVASIAAVLLTTDFSVAAALRALFLRPEFCAPRALDGLVRSPVEWCVALMRATGLPATETHPEWFLRAMGQAPFAPPSVAGWPGQRRWISTAAAQARADHAAYVSWKAQGAGVFADLVDRPPDDAVTRALAAFGVDRVSPSTVDALVAWLTAQRNRPWTGWYQQRALVILAALSPEAQLA